MNRNLYWFLINICTQLCPIWAHVVQTFYNSNKIFWSIENLIMKTPITWISVLWLFTTAQRVWIRLIWLNLHMLFSIDLLLYAYEFNLFYLFRYVEEHIQKTGVAIETQGFTFVTSGKKRESLTVRNLKGISCRKFWFNPRGQSFFIDLNLYLYLVIISNWIEWFHWK